MPPSPPPPSSSSPPPAATSQRKSFSVLKRERPIRWRRPTDDDDDDNNENDEPSELSSPTSAVSVIDSSEQTRQAEQPGTPIRPADQGEDLKTMREEGQGQLSKANNNNQPEQRRSTTTTTTTKQRALLSGRILSSGGHLLEASPSVQSAAAPPAGQPVRAHRNSFQMHWLHRRPSSSQRSARQQQSGACEHLRQLGSHRPASRSISGPRGPASGSLSPGSESATSSVGPRQQSLSSRRPAAAHSLRLQLVATSWSVQLPSARSSGHHSGHRCRLHRPSRQTTTNHLSVCPSPTLPSTRHISLDSGALIDAGTSGGQRASQHQLDSIHATGSATAACCLSGSPSAGLVLRADSGRRESFLYRTTDNDYEVSPKSVSRHSSIGSEW